MFTRPISGYRKSSSKRSLPLVISAKPYMMEWLRKALDHAEIAHPHYLPTIIPPRPWEDTRNGGYWTNYARTPLLIRFKAHQETQKQCAIDEYDAIDMPEVYRAVNILQDTPWTINERVLRIVEQCWALDMGIAALPALTAIPAPPQPADMDTNEDAAKAWRKQAKGVKRRNNSLISRMKRSHSIVTTAQTFTEHDKFHFPHMLDFRGRIYSIVSGMSPQGDDLGRGLMVFRQGMATTPKGARWLAIHLANCMGNDKISEDDRVAWVHANEETWRAIAEAPVEEHLTWSTVGKPWQALAAILEWVDYLNTGLGFISHIPVSVDGTCNGLQHLTAILRDAEAAPLVNLIAGDRPNDIYGVAAVKWQGALEALIAAGGEDAKKAASFVEWAGGFPLSRYATKRQVMVLPYGGTREAFFKYTREWLDETDKFDYDIATKDQLDYRMAVVGLASRTLWAVVSEMLPGAMSVMKWLQECSKAAADSNQPLFWTVPGSGFVVRHFYGKQKARIVEIKLDGTRHQLKVYETLKDLDVKAQTQGVAPNFIHSLDAAALVMTINRAHDAGITSLTAIHDAYGAHAENMDALGVILRQAFVDLHQHDVLECFRKACREVAIDMLRSRGVPDDVVGGVVDERIPPMPLKGTLDIGAVVGSPYFFS
jgi:DNA-directed RNA polymerase, mitochondrial